MKMRSVITGLGLVVMSFVAVSAADARPRYYHHHHYVHHRHWHHR